MNGSDLPPSLPALPARVLRIAKRFLGRLAGNARDLPFHLDRYRRRRALADVHAVAAARLTGGTIPIEDLALLRSELRGASGAIAIDADARDASQLRILLRDLPGVTIHDTDVAGHGADILVSTSGEAEPALRVRHGLHAGSRLLRASTHPNSAPPPLGPLSERRGAHVVVLNDFGFRGRIGESMRRQVLALLLSGYEVTVACWTTEAHLSEPAISSVDISALWRGYRGLHRFYARSKSHDLFAADVVQVVREQKPDLVLLGRCDGVPYPAGVVERLRSLSIPIIPYHHERPLPEVLPSSLAMGFGVDETMFAPLPRATARRLLGLADDRPLVVMRAIVAGDAHHDAALFDAVRSALTARSDVGLILYGPNSHRMKSTRSFGLVQQALMPLIFSAADIFVSTNVAETIGDATSEAMACGLAVVGPRTGRIEDLVVDGQTGLLVAAPTAENVVGAIDKLSADVELRQRMGTAGRQRVEERFTLHHLAGAWRDALTPLLPGDRSR